ncbi:MAG: RNA methyltransferase [Cyanobacteria bacterium P01_A01_bin.105]
MMIVCAALVQNPLNLGGLCRTCEVLGAERLIVPDLALAQRWDFRKLAASGQRWQPLEECPPEQVVPWLIQQRDYRRVALTVTGALPLTEYRFSPNTVLVLGQELTGVPDAVLAVCDDAIAIPQYGQVESLNVHTAAAIALYEYRRQHPL